MTTQRMPQGHRNIGSSNPSNVPRTPQRPWHAFNNTSLITRTAQLTTAAAKAPILFEPDDPAGFQDDIANGRLFYTPAAEGSCGFSCFGAGNDNSEGRLAVWGWLPTINTGRMTNSGMAFGWWEPTLLLITHPVLSAKTGIAQGSGVATRPHVLDTERYADQFVSSSDYTLDPGFRQVGSGADSIAMGIFDFVGYPVLEFELTCRDSSDGTANNCTGLALRARTL